jgi:hypothetical protein
MCYHCSLSNYTSTGNWEEGAKYVRDYPNFPYLSKALNKRMHALCRWLLTIKAVDANKCHEPVFGYAYPIFECQEYEDALMLLNARPDLNVNVQHPKDGRTPLHVWLQKGWDIAPLLKRGADERIKNKEGLTPAEAYPGCKLLQLKKRAPILSNFRKLMVLLHANETGELQVTTAVIRELRQFLYKI